MADSQPPGPTDERSTSSPGTTVLKRSFSQLAMEYEDDGSPASSSSTQSTGSLVRRASDRGTGGSSNSPRHSDMDSHDRQDRSKRARSASFEGSRDIEQPIVLAGPSGAASTSSNTGHISDSSSDSWTAIQASSIPVRTGQDASTQNTSFEDTIALLRAPSRSSPPRRAFVHRHSQRRPRLFARELSPSSQEDRRGASHGERAARPPSEVIMISDTESDDQPLQSTTRDPLVVAVASTVANATETNLMSTNSSNERQANRIDLPSFATLFPEHRSADASTNLSTSSNEAVVLPESEQNVLRTGSGPAETSSAAPMSSNGQESHTSNHPSVSDWSAFGSFQSRDEAARLSLLPDNISASYPSPRTPWGLTSPLQERHDIASNYPSTHTYSTGPSSRPDYSGGQVASEATPSGSQDNQQVEHGSQASGSTAPVPPRSFSPSPIALLGDLDRTVDYLEAVTSQPSDEPAVSVPSGAGRESAVDEAMGRLAARMRHIRDLAAEGWSSPQTRRQSSRASNDSGGSTGSMALRHARLIEERERERQRTLSLPARSTLVEPSSSSSSVTSSSSPQHRSTPSGSPRRQTSGRRANMLRSILLDRMAERDGPSLTRGSDGSAELSEADRRLDQRMDEVLDLYTDQASRHRHDRRGHDGASSSRPSRRSRAHHLASQDIANSYWDLSQLARPMMDGQVEDSPSSSVRDTRTQLDSLARPLSGFGPGRTATPVFPTASSSEFGDPLNNSLDYGQLSSDFSADFMEWFADPSFVSPSAEPSSSRASISATAAPSRNNAGESLAPSRQASFSAAPDLTSSGERESTPQITTRTSDITSSSSSFSSYATARTSLSSPNVTSPHRPLVPPVPPSSFTYIPFQLSPSPPSRTTTPAAAGGAHAPVASSFNNQEHPSPPIATGEPLAGPSLASSRNPSPVQATSSSRSQLQSPPSQPDLHIPAPLPPFQESSSLRANTSAPPQPSAAVLVPSLRASTNTQLSTNPFSRPPTAPQSVAFPSRPSSTAIPANTPSLSRPGSSARYYHELFPRMVDFSQERSERSAPIRPSSVRPTRSHRPEITAQQRTALEQINALDGSLLTLLGSAQSSDATITAASRAMAAVNELRRNIQRDMIDGPRRREDSTSIAAANFVGASRTVTYNPNQGTNSSQQSYTPTSAQRDYRRRRVLSHLSPGTNEEDFIRSAGTTRQPHEMDEWDQMLREAERRIVRTSSSRPPSTSRATPGDPSAQGPSVTQGATQESTPPILGLSNSQRRQGEERRDSDAAANSPFSLPFASRRRIATFTPVFEPSSSLIDEIVARRVPDDPPADDRWARERRRRHELQNELLDETRLLQERPAQSSPARFTGEMSTIEIPVVDPSTMQQVGTSSFDIPVFVPARASPLHTSIGSDSTSGSRNNEQRPSTSPVSMTHRASPHPSGATRPETPTVNPSAVPVTNTIGHPSQGEHTPSSTQVDSSWGDSTSLWFERASSIPSWGAWHDTHASSQAVPGSVNPEPSTVDSRMDVDSDEEVSMLFQESGSMATDGAIRQDNSNSTDSRGSDHVVAQSHERHRTQSGPTTSASTRPAAARREINLDAYHDGPFRAALARTVANQRRREELLRARERIRLGVPLGDSVEMPFLRASNLSPAPVSQGNPPPNASRPVSRPTDPLQPGSGVNTIPFGIPNSRLESATSITIMDEDDEDSAEIQRLLVEPSGQESRPWVHPLRRTDSETWGGLPSSSGTARVARERMYEQALERRGNMWLPRSSGGLEPSRRGSGFEITEHYQHLLHSMSDDIRSSGRGTSETVINNLPGGTYGEWATPGESEERCPICFEDYEQNEPVLRLPTCSHWFHKPCLIQWLKTARTCPMCRTPVENARERRTFALWMRGNGHGPTARTSTNNGSNGRTSNPRVRTARPPSSISGQDEAGRRDGPPPTGGSATRRRVTTVNAPPSGSSHPAPRSFQATPSATTHTGSVPMPASGATSSAGTTSATRAPGARSANRRNQGNGPANGGSLTSDWFDWTQYGADDDGNDDNDEWLR